MSTYALGLDLGGSSVKAVAVSDAGEIVTRKNVEFRPDQEGDWARQIKETKNSIENELGAPPVSIGLSAPGMAARDGRSIAFMPGRLAGLQGLDWTHYLQNRTMVPVLNDAHAALLGEIWLGAAPGLTNVILLTLGTGVGGAAMVDGQLIRGHLGRAGHLGHVCLDLDGLPGITRIPGSLEEMIGNCSIRARTGGRFESTHALITAHLSGEAEASKIWLKSVRALGCAIASLINVLDPEVVVVGGGIIRAGPALFDPLAAVLDEVEWRPGGHQVRILPAKLGEFAGAAGAAFHGRGQSSRGH